MPLMAPNPPPEPQPAPLAEPWSWSVAELGEHLTEPQRQTVLARLRVNGYAVREWTYPPPTT